MSAQSAVKLVRISDRQSLESPSPLGPPAVLQELAERFGVSWVLLPEFMSARGERNQVGFVLELQGRHQAPSR